MKKDNSSFDENLKKITQIAEWFDNQAQVDVEEGLKKIREAAKLLKDSKKRLSEIENEFEEIKKEVEEAIPSEAGLVPQNTAENSDDSNIPF